MSGRSVKPTTVGPVPQKKGPVFTPSLSTSQQRGGLPHSVSIAAITMVIKDNTHD